MPWSRLSRFIGDGRPPSFNDGNPKNGYINPYYWIDDHPLLYGNNGSLDPGTYIVGKKGTNESSSYLLLNMRDSNYHASSPKSINVLKMMGICSIDGAHGDLVLHELTRTRVNCRVWPSFFFQNWMFFVSKRTCLSWPPEFQNKPNHSTGK